ncbi:hypothetical protein [Aquimarina rhabdastrellae]
MAPLKFEEDIKEKLDERVIKPSVSSWEQLAERLDEVPLQQSKKKAILRYMAIAACFIGILILSTVYTIDIEKQNHIDIVESIEENEEIKQEETTRPLEIISTEQIAIQKELETSVASKTIKTSKREEKEKSNKLSKSQRKVEKKSIVEAIAHEENKVIHKVEKLINKEQLSVPVEDAMTARVNEVVAQITALQQQKDVTEEEIDALLLKAQRDITTTQYEKAGTVDAMALLLDVETELDETFKQRVFEALKAGLKRVKTAVAEKDF